MPAKQFIEKFPFDPSTFNFDQFKEKLLEELTGDEDLSQAKITELTEQNTGYATSTRDLKARLFDATVLKQGDAVAPIDSPAGAAGGNSTEKVPDADIFG